MKEIVINKEIIRKLNEKNVGINYLLFLLCCVDRDEEGIALFQNTDIEITLFSWGYITPTPSLTEKGKQFLEEIIGKVSNKIDISNKWHDLHKELQAELLKLTGKKQAKANGDYPFLCNEQDLQHKLSKVITKYKLTDWEKIKKLLILHVRKAHKQKFEKVFLLQYYVEKNGMSTLASDYENFVEKEEEKVINTQENKGVFDL